jgi:hypothetical protein
VKGNYKYKKKSRYVILYDSDDDESDDYESSCGKEEETDEDLDEEAKTSTFKVTRSPYYTRSTRNHEKNVSHESDFVEKSKSESEDQALERSEEDPDTGEDINEAQCQLIVRKRRYVNAVTKEFKKAVIDSGCEVHLATDVKVLDEVLITYSKNNSPLELSTASGSSMEIKATGQINGIAKKVHDSPQLQYNLLSGPQLQEEGNWVIFPPAENHKSYRSYEYDSKLSNAGCIVTNGDGKVKMFADKNLIVDLDKIDSYNIYIILPLLKSSNRIINNCYLQMILKV